MKKPEKKLITFKPDNYGQDIRNANFNQACDVWEKWYKETYDKPLQRFTPQGSEFVDNPERCFEYIKERLDENSQARKDLALFKIHLPNEIEINQLYCKDCPHKICKQECDMNRWIVTNAFSKRIGNDGQGQK